MNTVNILGSRCRVPDPAKRVQSGSEHKTNLAIMRTIDQASLEGSKEWILDVMNQLDLAFVLRPRRSEARPG